MKFSAVLLTGGKSTRMGRDKASLPYQGGLLWGHQIQTLSATGAAEILISGPEDGVYANAGYVIVSDVYRERGPIEGLRATLEKATHGHVLLLAIDLPHMTADYLKKLWSQCTPGCGAVGVGQAYEPLAAFYPNEILPLLESLVSRGDYSFQKLIAEAESLGLMARCPLSSEDLGLFFNWNFPDPRVQN